MLNRHWPGGVTDLRSHVLHPGLATLFSPYIFESMARPRCARSSISANDEEIGGSPQTSSACHAHGAHDQGPRLLSPRRRLGPVFYGFVLRSTSQKKFPSTGERQEASCRLPLGSGCPPWPLQSPIPWPCRAVNCQKVTSWIAVCVLPAINLDACESTASRS